ncbi:MAG TPA: ribokinase [Beijerinckiaceae bacterium]|jgi:ribokinase
MGRVVVLGIFAADLAFTAPRLPHPGETLLGSAFALGPGGKGSNQAIAARRAGADVAFVSRIGRDAFGEMSLSLWQAEGIDTRAVSRSDKPTGTAFIFRPEGSAENAIIVVSGAAGDLNAEDVTPDLLDGAGVMLTQLEQPYPAAQAALARARAAGLVTILNPAPASREAAALLPLADYVTPNESEAALLTGCRVDTIEDARAAGDALIDLGAGCAVITLGERGALFHTPDRSTLIPAMTAGPAVDTTGAGDAFNGAFAAALAEGQVPFEAARFAVAAAGLSVTKPGAGAAMAHRAAIDALIAARA